MLQRQGSKSELVSDCCNFSSEHSLCKWKAELENIPLSCSHVTFVQEAIQLQLA